MGLDQTKRTTNLSAIMSLSAQMQENDKLATQGFGSAGSIMEQNAKFTQKYYELASQLGDQPYAPESKHGLEPKG